MFDGNIEDHLRLIHKSLKELNITPGDQRYDDLYQTGAMGLIAAASRFDPSKGFEFSTYAVSTISGYIKSYITDSKTDIRIPRHQVEKYYRFRKLIDQGFTEEEALTKMRVKKKVMDGILANSEIFMTLSLDQTFIVKSDADAVSLGNMIDSGVNTENQVIDNSTEQDILYVMYFCLTKGELEVIRYFINGERNMSYIGHELRCTRSYVHQTLLIMRKRTAKVISALAEGKITKRDAIRALRKRRSGDYNRNWYSAPERTPATQEAIERIKEYAVSNPGKLFSAKPVVLSLMPTLQKGNRSGYMYFVEEARKELEAAGYELDRYCVGKRISAPLETTEKMEQNMDKLIELKEILEHFNYKGDTENVRMQEA
jgi:RNA polymerase sigma factor (sigma-70 family)